MILPKAKPGQRRRTEHSNRVCPQAPVPQGFRGSNPTPRKNGGTPRSGGTSTGIGEHPLPRTNPIILQHALWMQQQGYRTSTIKAAVKTLKAVNNRCNLQNPTELKTHLATTPYSGNRRHKIITDTNRLYRQLKIPWQPPRSQPVGVIIPSPAIY